MKQKTTVASEPIVQERTLVAEYPWKGHVIAELGYLAPDMDAEVDGDRKTVRIYRLG